MGRNAADAVRSARPKGKKRRLILEENLMIDASCLTLKGVMLRADIIENKLWYRHFL